MKKQKIENGVLRMAGTLFFVMLFIGVVIAAGANRINEVSTNGTNENLILNSSGTQIIAEKLFNASKNLVAPYGNFTNLSVSTEFVQGDCSGNDCLVIDSTVNPPQIKVADGRTVDIPNMTNSGNLNCGKLYTDSSGKVLCGSDGGGNDITWIEAPAITSNASIRNGDINITGNTWLAQGNESKWMINITSNNVLGFYGPYAGKTYPAASITDAGNTASPYVMLRMWGSYARAGGTGDNLQMVYYDINNAGFSSGTLYVRTPSGTGYICLQGKNDAAQYQCFDTNNDIPRTVIVGAQEYQYVNATDDNSIDVRAKSFNMTTAYWNQSGYYACQYVNSTGALIIANPCNR